MSRFKKFIFYFFSIYLFLTPLMPLKIKVFNKSIPPSDVMLFLIFALYLFFVAAFRENRTKLLYNAKSFILDKFNIAVIVLFIVMLISVTYATSKGVAVKETFRFGTYAAVLYIFQTEYNSKEWQSKIITISLLAAVAVCFFGIFQYFTSYGLDPKLIDKVTNAKRIPSTLDNPNTLAAYLMLFLFPVISAVINRKPIKEKLLYIVILALFIVNIFMTGSRSALIGMVVGILVFVLLVSWKYIVYFSAVGLLSLFFKPINSRIFAIFDSTLNTSRIKLWGLGMKMVQNNPILGVGNGNYVTNYNDYVKRYPYLRYEYYKDFPSHNSYIKVWSELGILGILSFISIVVLSIKRVYDFIKECGDARVRTFYVGFLCSLSSFYVMNFFDNLLFVPKVALYFWIFLSFKKSHS